MAAKSRGTDPSVERLLFEEGYRFDFFQAVRVLERLYPERQPVGHDAAPGNEVARFRSLLSLNFPPSAVNDVAQPQNEDTPPQMTVAFMGLTGPSGVLPRHYTEMLLERVRRKDTTLRDFLDLFNHRLISFFYRAWEKYHFPVAYERALLKDQGEDHFTTHLFDLMGMGTKGLRGKLALRDETLLLYTGLLAQQPRSASNLKGLLQDYFGVPVDVRQFVGAWLPLSPENRTRLGARAMNTQLGVNVVVGNRIWDQQAKFRLRVGPMTQAQFSQFLPVGNALRPLMQLSRFFAGQECDFDVQLVLEKTEVPGCRLGDTGACPPRLGWSAWLKGKEFTRDADDTVFTGGLAQVEVI